MSPKQRSNYLIYFVVIINNSITEGLNDRL